MLDRETQVYSSKVSKNAGLVNAAENIKFITFLHPFSSPTF